jgi:hypothetical protein
MKYSFDPTAILGGAEALVTVTLGDASTRVCLGAYRNQETESR